MTLAVSRAYCGISEEQNGDASGPRTGSGGEKTVQPEPGTVSPEKGSSSAHLPKALTVHGISAGRSSECQKRIAVQHHGSTLKNADRIKSADIHCFPLEKNEVAGILYTVIMAR